MCRPLDETRPQLGDYTTFLPQSTVKPWRWLCQLLTISFLDYIKCSVKYLTFPLTCSCRPVCSAVSHPYSSNGPPYCWLVIQFILQCRNRAIHYALQCCDHAMLYVRPLLNRVQAIRDHVATVQRPFRDRFATVSRPPTTVSRPCNDRVSTLFLMIY